LPFRGGKLIKVLLGDTELKETPDSPSSRIEIGIHSIIIHPDYSTGLKYNDIALIKLARKVPLLSSSNNIRPACLPQSKQRLELITDRINAVGWGLTEYLGDNTCSKYGF
jgi:hypothetical protein